MCLGRRARLYVHSLACPSQQPRGAPGRCAQLAQGRSVEVPVGVGPARSLPPKPRTPRGEAQWLQLPAHFISEETGAERWVAESRCQPCGLWASTQPCRGVSAVNGDSAPGVGRRPPPAPLVLVLYQGSDAAGLLWNPKPVFPHSCLVADSLLVPSRLCHIWSHIWCARPPNSNILFSEAGLGHRGAPGAPGAWRRPFRQHRSHRTSCVISGPVVKTFL